MVDTHNLCPQRLVFGHIYLPSIQQEVPIDVPVYKVVMEPRRSELFDLAQGIHDNLFAIRALSNAA